MKLMRIIKGCIFVVLFGCMFIAAGATAESPNIVLVLADDFGWGDVSCNNPGAAFRTPNIDRIAGEGVRFTNAFTPHSVCTPTRYALLTGRYCWRTHVREGVLAGYGKSLIGRGRMTLASLLKRHGYRTGAFGKWHVGLDWVPVEGDPGDFHWGTQVRGKGAVAAVSLRVDHSRPVTLGPTDIGFDTCFITPSNNTRIPVWFRDDRVVGSPKRDKTGLMRDPGVQRDKVDDVFVKEAIAFMEDCAKNHKDRPFFVYLPLNAAHGATQPPARFKGKSGDGLRGDKCLWVNESVGKMLDALERLGAAEDTLVIFSADNGPIAPKGYKPDTPHRAAGPYRGYKTDAWDGGCRVPFLARWPGRIKAGRTHDGLLCLTDMLATFASLVGEDLPKWAGEDSINQLPALLGKTKDSLREDLITQSYTGVLSVRRGPWKLIIDTEGSGGHTVTPGTEPVISGSPWEFAENTVGQLYHIVSDPYETTDLYGEHPELVAGMKQYLITAVNTGRTRP